MASSTSQEEKYTVSLKYEMFSFSEEIIKSINFQNQGSVLVFCSGQDNDSLKLVNSTINKDYMSAEQIQKVEFNAMQIKSVQSANLLKWSPNDQYLASACEKLVIWAYAHGDLIKLKDFKDHELEIAAISWAPDSSRIASGSLDGKIVVRSLDLSQNTPKIKELSNDNKILGLVWDTYDKYLAALYSDNNVIIWKCNSWDKSFVVSLTCPISVDHAKITSKRDDRKIDWSPDYRYVLLPSLDDKIVPFVCALDRQKDFKVCKTFMGPFSSINCVKFNPNLYAHKETVINIFALGDNDGNISIWGIGDNYTARKPFFLFKSHPNGNELIEDICWNAEGNMLIATTLKKYVFVALFGPSVFGERLSSVQKQDFLEGKYGTLRTVAATNTKFKTFKATNESAAGMDSLSGLDNRVQDQLQRLGDQKNGTISFGFSASTSAAAQADKNQEILTKVTYTEQKTFTENGKKRIIPSKQIITKVVVEKKVKNKPKIGFTFSKKLGFNYVFVLRGVVKSQEEEEQGKVDTKETSMIEEKSLENAENERKQNGSQDSGNPQNKSKEGDQLMEVETSEVKQIENTSTMEQEISQNGEQAQPGQIVETSAISMTAVQNDTAIEKATAITISDNPIKGNEANSVTQETAVTPILSTNTQSNILNTTNTTPLAARSNVQAAETTIPVNIPTQNKKEISQKPSTAVQKTSILPPPPSVQQQQHQPPATNQILLRPSKPIPNPFTLRLPSQQIGSGSDMCFLEIEAPISGSQTTQIKCVVLRRSRTPNGNNFKESLWSDTLQGQVLFVELAKSTLLYYTSNNLLYFVNSNTGRREQLPLLIPGVCWLKFNVQGYILVLLSTGELRVYFDQKILLRDNIMPILTGNAMHGDNLDKDPIENVAVDKSGVPVIFLKNHMAFMYSRDLRTWLKLDDLNMNIGCFYETSGMNGSTNNGTENVALKSQQADEFNVFFDNLLTNAENNADTVNAGMQCENDSSSSAPSMLQQQQQLKSLENISSYEERLIYLMRYDTSKNQDTFIDTATKYIKKLIDCKELNKIRQFITDLFANPSAQEYQFLQLNNFDQVKLFRSIKRILDYIPFTSELAVEIEEIVQLSHINSNLS